MSSSLRRSTRRRRSSNFGSLAEGPSDYDGSRDEQSDETDKNDQNEKSTLPPQVVSSSLGNDQRTDAVENPPTKRRRRRRLARSNSCNQAEGSSSDNNGEGEKNDDPPSRRAAKNTTLNQTPVAVVTPPTKRSSHRPPTASSQKRVSPRRLVHTSPANNDDSSQTDDDKETINNEKDKTPTSTKKKPAARTKKDTSNPPSRAPPPNWEEIYSLVEELRRDRTAPCDHSGCEALGDAGQPPAVWRFQTLVALLLSSQTKDAVVGQAIRSMQADHVLTIEGVRQLAPEQLTNNYLKSVGFRNRKTEYLQQVATILQDQYNSDIPPTAAEMMQLPGIGPKMAYICEAVAWCNPPHEHLVTPHHNDVPRLPSGIGVDTHMNRLFAKLEWTKLPAGKTTVTPEMTRQQLEAWLPKERWATVNLLWVGFGQEVQQETAKILQKAINCSRPKEALRLLQRCGCNLAKEGKKHGLSDEINNILRGNASGDN